MSESLKMALLADPRFLNACADAGVNPTAVDWQKILALLAQILPIILAFFQKTPEPTPPTA